MTKTGAIIAMNLGHKVTHRFFSSNEWMTIENGKYVFEDGNRCNYERFWENRIDHNWDFDWSIYEN